MRSEDAVVRVTYSDSSIIATVSFGTSKSSETLERDPGDPESTVSQHYGIVIRI
jgi:hypothetical protein